MLQRRADRAWIKTTRESFRKSIADCESLDAALTKLLTDDDDDDNMQSDALLKESKKDEKE